MFACQLAVLLNDIIAAIKIRVLKLKDQVNKNPLNKKQIFQKMSAFLNLLTKFK